MEEELSAAKRVEVKQNIKRSDFRQMLRNDFIPQTEIAWSEKMLRIPYLLHLVQLENAFVFQKPSLTCFTSTRSVTTCDTAGW